MAQAKTNDIKQDISNLEANLAQESASVIQKMQAEVKKEKPTEDDGSTVKMMKKKIGFVEKKINSIEELLIAAQLETNKDSMKGTMDRF